MNENEEFEFRARLEAEQAASGSQPQATAIPSMAEVAMNAVPKGAANLFNTPITLGNLLAHGIEKLTGAAGLTGASDAMKFMREGGQLDRNVPMELAEKTGLVDPSKNPQTGPQRIVDMAIQAAVGSAAIPGAGVAGAAKNAAIGAASGATAQTVKEGTGSDLLALIAGVAVPLAGSIKPLIEKGFRAVKPAPQSPLNTKTRLQTLNDAQELGFVVQPTSVKPTAEHQILESVAGAGKLNIELSMKNQQVATQVAKQALGLPKDAELTVPVLDELRKVAAKPYQDIAAASPKAAEVLEKLKQARIEANEYYRYYYKTGDPKAGKIAKNWAEKAKGFETVIDDEARAVGDPTALERLRAGRTLIARAYDVERALNVGDGHVSLRILGKMYDDGKPLSGELEVMGRFANAFEKVTMESSKLGTAASGTDAASAAMLSSAGNSVAAGGLPLLRNSARKKLLSDDVQQHLTKERPLPGLASPAARAAITGNAVQGNAGEEE